MISFEDLLDRRERLAVVGLGYVGLPLAVELAKHFDVIGYDLKKSRIHELRKGHDRTLEVSGDELGRVQIDYTAAPEALASSKMIIVAVPTPIDDYRIPDLGPLKRSAATVGENLTVGSCVVFESTVYPGATEEVCVPVMEERSGLVLGRDFSVGYSPERINPGDKIHTVDKIVKIVAGSDGPTLDLLESVYGRIVKAGIHRASSIKVAEAAKVIENTQRDLNIALMNELAMIFDRIGIDTHEVLAAAETKWNFLSFQPGLVGGHCIGVERYYLTFKAESLGYHPEMILAGRRINDNMGKVIAEKVVKMLIRTGKPVRGARIGVLGVTFKENVPDLRNTRVVDIISELHDYGVEVVAHDPMADPVEAERLYGLQLHDLDSIGKVDGVIVSVVHQHYLQMGLPSIAGLCKEANALIVDVKGGFDPQDAERLGITYWRL